MLRKNKYKKCNVETVYKIAKAFNLSVKELMEENIAEIKEPIPIITKFDYYKKTYEI